MKKLIYSLIALTNFAFSQTADKPENIAPLLIGETIPSIELVSNSGKTESTDAFLNKKSVIIVYRGGWCPYCNKQLAEMQTIEKDILALGYQIIAISPDAPSFLKETTAKEKLNYQLFSDSEGKFSKTIGIAFSTPEKYAKMLGKYSEEKNTNWLPVPTVYVVNDKKQIQFMYINPDYATRLKANTLLAVLKTL